MNIQITEQNIVVLGIEFMQWQQYISLPWLSYWPEAVNILQADKSRVKIEQVYANMAKYNISNAQTDNENQSNNIQSIQIQLEVESHFCESFIYSCVL